MSLSNYYYSLFVSLSLARARARSERKGLPRVSCAELHAADWRPAATSDARGLVIARLLQRLALFRGDLEQRIELGIEAAQLGVALADLRAQ